MSATMAHATVPARTTHYDLLDGLRGVAAFIVVWLHITNVCEIFAEPPNAFLAVDFFFCLSGFVIAHAHADRLRDGAGGRRFMRRRAARLMPPAVLGAGLGGGVLLVRGLLHGDVAPTEALAATALNALLLPSLDLVPAYSEAYGANPPLWSLLQEMLASVAFALVLARLSTAHLAVLTALAACLTAGIGLFADSLDLGTVKATVWYGPARVAFPFLCGLLIQRLPIVPNRHGWLVAILLSVVLLWPTTSLAAQLLAVFLLCPAIIYRGAGARLGPKGALACRRLGALSYPLYAVHYPVIRLVALMAEQAGLRSPVAIAATAAALSLATAVIATRLLGLLSRPSAPGLAIGLGDGPLAAGAGIRAN